jgi:hypothetical protein
MIFRNSYKGSMQKLAVITVCPLRLKENIPPGAASKAVDINIQEMMISMPLHGMMATAAQRHM